MRTFDCYCRLTGDIGTGEDMTWYAMFIVTAPTNHVAARKARGMFDRTYSDNDKVTAGTLVVYPRDAALTWEPTESESKLDMLDGFPPEP